MTRATGEPHSAARAHAQPDDGPLDGSLPDEVPTFREFETLVDAQLEKLVCRAAANLRREPEHRSFVPDDVDGVRW